MIQFEKKNPRSFYRKHHNSFRLVPFRLLVVCAIFYTDVVVYSSTGKLNLKVNLHVLIGHGEKRDLKLISFFVFCLQLCCTWLLSYLCFRNLFML